MNIIKNNDGFYYINIRDNSLYRSNQDMSENNKIIDGPIDQFYIENQTIYYIGYDYEDNNGGIFKSNIDGTNKQQIGSGAASFLNILENKLYYCDGLDGGNLCTIDKDGHTPPYYWATGPINDKHGQPMLQNHRRIGHCRFG